VARLERDGYVRREDCMEDRRGFWAVLTDKGAEVLRAAAPGHVAQVRKYLFDQLSQAQTAEFGEIVTTVERRLRDSSSD